MLIRPTQEPVLGPLWNVGCKVLDLDADLEFWRALGADVVVRDRLDQFDGQPEYAIVAVGDTRVLLTTKPPFEDAVPDLCRPGMTHAVFEVDDHEAASASLANAGATELVAPIEIEGAFGRRRIAFFSTPDGLIIEALKILAKT